MKTEHIAAASNELMKPVNVLAFLISILKRTGDRDPSEAEIIESMNICVLQLRRMLGSVLDAIKIEQNLQLENEVFALNPLLRRILLQTEGVIRRSGIDLRVVPTKLVVRSNPAAVEIILRSVLLNACYFAPDGKVLVGCRRQHDEVNVYVCDTGIGLPKQLAEDPFEVRTRLGNDPDAGQAGLGLGLATAQELANGLGQTLLLVPHQGAGTSAILKLPLVCGHPDDVIAT